MLFEMPSDPKLGQSYPRGNIVIPCIHLRDDSRPHMHISNHSLAWLIDILESDLFFQLAPFFILFFVPTFVLFLATTVNPARLFYTLIMGLENIGASLSRLLPQSSGAGSSHATKKARKLRNRVEHVVQNC